MQVKISQNESVITNGAQPLNCEEQIVNEWKINTQISVWNTCRLHAI